MKKLLLATVFSLLAAPAFAQSRIAVTMTSFDNPFLTILLNGMREDAKKKNIDLIAEDAQLDPAKQLNQVQNFVANGVDAIIVNPVDGDSTAAITRAAADANIPLIYVNHPPAELDTGMPEKTAFVGSNELDSGTMEAEAVCKLLAGKEQGRGADGTTGEPCGPGAHEGRRDRFLPSRLQDRYCRKADSKLEQNTGAGSGFFLDDGRHHL